MNKRVLLISLIVVVIGSIFFIYRTSATTGEPELSQEEISELVQVQYPGSTSEPILQLRDGDPVYQVHVEQDNGQYTILLDGDTGKVLDLYASQSTKGKDNQADNNNNSVEETEKENKKKNETPNENNAMISSQEAKEIALQEFSGKVIDLELDEDDGVMIYEIEIVNGNKEASIEINAYTGDVIVMEIDTDD